MNLLNTLNWMNVGGYIDSSTSSTIIQDVLPISAIPKKITQRIKQKSLSKVQERATLKKSMRNYKK